MKQEPKILVGKALMVRLAAFYASLDDLDTVVASKVDFVLLSRPDIHSAVNRLAAYKLKIEYLKSRIAKHEAEPAVGDGARDDFRQMLSRTRDEYQAWLTRLEEMRRLARKVRQWLLHRQRHLDLKAARRRSPDPC